MEFPTSINTISQKATQSEDSKTTDSFKKMALAADQIPIRADDLVRRIDYFPAVI
jgi:hypothetical protein